MIYYKIITFEGQEINNAYYLANYIKKQIKDKGNIVVLMHDSSSKILTYETLRDVIKYLKDQGYTFDNFYSIMQ